eukprot:6201059-Pleurochrysis_carterae.AAC.1
MHRQLALLTEGDHAKELLHLATVEALAVGGDSPASLPLAFLLLRATTLCDGLYCASGARVTSTRA